MIHNPLPHWQAGGGKRSTVCHDCHIGCDPRPEFRQVIPISTGAEATKCEDVRESAESSPAFPASRTPSGTAFAFSVAMAAEFVRSAAGLSTGRSTGAAVMPIFRWGQSWNLFQDLEQEVDRLLHGVDMTFHGVRFGRQFPAINLYQLDDEYLLTAELPGMRAEELDVSIASSILTLKGSRAELGDVPDDQFRRRERYQGSWQRSFPLPERVQEERLSAEFNNGILVIHLPKADETQPRQIPVIDGTD